MGLFAAELNGLRRRLVPSNFRSLLEANQA